MKSSKFKVNTKYKGVRRTTGGTIGSFLVRFRLASAVRRSGGDGRRPTGRAAPRSTVARAAGRGERRDRARQGKKARETQTFTNSERRADRYHATIVRCGAVHRPSHRPYIVPAPGAPRAGPLLVRSDYRESHRAVRRDDRPWTLHRREQHPISRRRPGLRRRPRCSELASARSIPSRGYIAL